MTLVLLAVSLPLWRLTHASAQSARPAATGQTASPEGAVQVHLAVAFTQKPVRFEIDWLGKPIWEEEAVQGATQEKTVAMAYPKEGIDLEYKVQWPAGTPLAAARLTVAAGDTEPLSKTVWGATQADDVLSFP